MELCEKEFYFTLLEEMPDYLKIVKSKIGVLCAIPLHLTTPVTGV
jgi:hypothetical protein